MKQYIVDAFTDKAFSGNPAAVCVMDKWPSEELMMKMAMENNLSETAFIVKEEQGYHLRWFTPGTEVELCGHATLASSFVILNFYEKDCDEVRFQTLSGELIIKRKENRYEMNFPTYKLQEIPVTDDMENAFGIRPIKAVLGLDLVCVFESEEQVRNMTPNQELLQNIPGRIQNATARGSKDDCVSRSFCPKLAILEDPVCGSAHCQIADYWSNVLDKKEIDAYQASKRGGRLHCELLGDGRIAISGEATLVAISEIMIGSDLQQKNVERVKAAMLSVQRYPWEQGVCMQAMYESGDTEIAVAMAHDAVLRQQPDGRLAVINNNIAVTDPAANGIVVKKAYEMTGDTFYLEAANRMLEYLMRKAPRTNQGVLCHNEISFHEGYSKDQIWADAIYMAPPFLAEMGELDEAVCQIQGMVQYLLDEQTGLLRHIYDAGTNRFVRDKLWATGNGWALMGMAAVTETAIKKHRDDLVQILTGCSKGILDSMLAYQLPDGRFHDLLDEKDTFVDGASAMMMATYIYRSMVNGTLSETYQVYADKVLKTMENYVDSYGIIHGVCGCPHFLSEGTSAESMAAYIMMHAWKDKLN